MITVTRFVIFDSDGNPIDAVDATEPDAAALIGRVVLQHYALVDEEPAADEPFLTIKREVTRPRFTKREFARRVYPLG